jgi:hypothetical protein
MPSWARSTVSLTISVIFIISLALSHTYPWIRYVWSAGLLVLIVGFSLNYLFEISVHGDSPKTIRGYPRWFVKFAMDEDAEDEPKS